MPPDLGGLWESKFKPGAGKASGARQWLAEQPPSRLRADKRSETRTPAAARRGRRAGWALPAAPRAAAQQRQPGAL